MFHKAPLSVRTLWLHCHYHHVKCSCSSSKLHAFIVPSIIMSHYSFALFSQPKWFFVLLYQEYLRHQCYQIKIKAFQFLSNVILITEGNAFCCFQHQDIKSFLSFLLFNINTTYVANLNFLVLIEKHFKIPLLLSDINI